MFLEKSRDERRTANSRKVTSAHGCMFLSCLLLLRENHLKIGNFVYASNEIKKRKCPTEYLLKSQIKNIEYAF